MVEKAPYERVKRLQNVEIRKYPEMILAVVEGYEGNTGFNFLFNYISGYNKIKQKIPMTAPVITTEKIPMTTPVITKKGYMAFVLPSQYTIETVPDPLDEKVSIRKQMSTMFAVLRFSGRTPHPQVKEQIEKLKHILDDEKIIIKDGPILMRYNSPFTPGFIRRNEVAFEIEDI
jgi:hypothetical protein